MAQDIKEEEQEKTNLNFQVGKSRLGWSNKQKGCCLQSTVGNEEDKINNYEKSPPLSSCHHNSLEDASNNP